jgi:homocitrate synthase
MGNKSLRFKGVVDTTFRDGQQSPLMFDSYKYRLTLQDKKDLIYGLIKLGVRDFEFFSPVVSTSEYEDFIQLKEYVKGLQIKNIRLLAHCRCHPTDIKRAIDAGFDGLNLYIGMTKIAQEFSHGIAFNEIISSVKNILSETRKKYPHLYLRFSAEDSFRTPRVDLYQMFDEVYMYVNTLGLPDTVGIATPELVKEKISALRNRYPEVDLECHFHNDRGFALINAVSAIQCGAAYIDTSVWGMAERSGITSVTGLLLNLYYENKSLCKNFDLKLCYPLNVLMGSILKHHVPPNEPVSITNRTHTAGVHQKAVLNNPHVYEAHDLSIFGVNSNNLLLGPLSGKNLIHYYLREIQFYDVTFEMAAKIAAEFKSMSSSMNKKNKPEKILADIVTNYHLSKLSIKEEFLKNRVENLN